MANQHISTRLDKAESAFFARETEFIMTRTFDAKPPELKGLMLVPMARGLPQGISEITYRRFFEAGESKIIADYAEDYPRVDVYGEEFTAKVYDIGDSFGYSVREIRQSMRIGKGLDQRRALAARRSNERKLNELTLKSSTQCGTYGMLDYPGITEGTLPADGVGGSTSWRNKTPDQILRDITDLMNAVIHPTNGQEVPDTLLLPLRALTDLTTRRLGDTEISLLKYVKDNFPQLTRIDWLNELSGMGQGGANRVFIGKIDADHIENQIINYFEQLETEKKGGSYVIPCQSTTAGVIVYYPMAFAYADGV
jgi:hypothetical protein